MRFFWVRAAWPLFHLTGQSDPFSVTIHKVWVVSNAMMQSSSVAGRGATSSAMSARVPLVGGWALRD
ncbi:MAG TPA: hypothetical protein VK789_10515 [Bryobacteraceae bacterium]|nr:hypothetical protein [Bryobacteraceae bacterium]